MSDLDDDLLALAGISDSEDESSKRKYDDIEPSDDNDSETNDELINPYPLEGKYKNEQDRGQLLDMDEVTREQILFERSQEMERYTEKKFLQDRLKQQQTKNLPTRSSKRSKTTGSNDRKSDKLSELRKQREKKKSRNYSDDEDDFDEEEEEEEEEEGLEDDDLDIVSDDDYDTIRTPWKEKAGMVPKKKSYIRAEYQDINKISIGRSFMVKYCFYPKFEEAIIGCYGRINLGINPNTNQPNYRMVKIIDIEHKPNKKYKLPKLSSDLYLLVSQNKKQTKYFPINVFSDSKITPEEYNKYLRELNKNNEEIEYIDDINEILENLNDEIINKSLNDKEINTMIENKQRLTKILNGYDAVFQKAQILDKIKIAKQQNNVEEIEKLTNELNSLDKLLLASSNKQSKANDLGSMAKVNERNRKFNLENIRKAEVKSQLLKKQNTANGNDDGNPFLRLKTVTRVFYQDIINMENEKAAKDAKVNYDNLIKEKTIHEKKIAESKYRILGIMDELINEIDIDFEDIDVIV